MSEKKEITLEKGIINICKNCENWIIYFHKVERRAWAMIYADENSFDKYHDKSIVRVMGGTGRRSIFGASRITRADIIEACEQSYL